jgi:hypothetical protein
MNAAANRLDPVTPDQNPVFPSQMIATCLQGHSWPVVVEWASVHVAGHAPDVTMRVPRAKPRRCLACFTADPRSKAVYTTLRHPEDMTIQESR